MNSPTSNSQKTFGFISVEEIEGLGHCGGLLIVSQIGRPIEFHCSAPVATNRAQKILYGETFSGYLYCEQIGLSLIDKTKSPSHLYIANCGHLLGLGETIDAPLVVLGGEPDKDFAGQVVFDHSGSEIQNQHRAHPDQQAVRTRSSSFLHDEQTLWYEDCNLQKLGQIQTILESFTKSLRLDEPFERIQKALTEAQAAA